MFTFSTLRISSVLTAAQNTARKVVLSTVVIAAAVAALGAGTGVLAPVSAHAQGLVEFARYDGTQHGNYQFSDIVRSDWGIAIPYCVKGTYETTKSTRGGGYRVNLQSETAFGTISDGNYLFVVSPDGNYLFTNRSDGMLMTPGGWGLNLSGQVVSPSGAAVALNGRAFTTPAGYTYYVAKDGARVLSLPNGSVFTLRDTTGPHMNPSGVYYD